MSAAGDMLVHPDNLPRHSQPVRSQSGVDEREAAGAPPSAPVLSTLRKSYRLESAQIRHRTDIHSLGQVPANQLHLNEIGFVSVESQRPLFYDPYVRNRQTGSFILIDPVTNDTLAAGMISGQEPPEPAGPVTPEERQARIGHSPRLILLPNADATTAHEVERFLFDQGYLVYPTDNLRGGEAAAAAGLIGLVFGKLNDEPKVLYDLIEYSAFDDIVQALTIALKNQ